jgi:hypothetical protein
LASSSYGKWPLDESNFEDCEYGPDPVAINECSGATFGSEPHYVISVHVADLNRALAICGILGLSSQKRGAMRRQMAQQNEENRTTWLNLHK